MLLQKGEEMKAIKWMCSKCGFYNPCLRSVCAKCGEIQKLLSPSGCEIVGCDEYDKIQDKCLHGGECKHSMFVAKPCPDCEQLKAQLKNAIKEYGVLKTENAELKAKLDKALELLERARCMTVIK